MTIDDQETRLINPCKKFLRFSDDKVVYYDKEKKENVEVKLPLVFTGLVQCAAVTGFDEPNGCGIFSNEVKNTTQQLLKVRSQKGGDIACGYYQDIKDRVKAAGGKFTAQLYCLIGDELARLDMRGAALQSWMGKENGTKYSISEFKKEKKGKVEYFVPVFKVEKFEKEDEKKAARDAWDKLMKGYLHPLWEKNQKELEVFHSNPMNEDVAMGAKASHVKASMPDNKLSQETIEEKTSAMVAENDVSEDDLPF